MVVGKDCKGDEVGLETYSNRIDELLERTYFVLT
jgi:hypothetical protein